MWAALARYGDKVTKIKGGYRIKPSTKEERLESCSPWQLTHQEQWRREFYRRRRARSQGGLALLKFITYSIYANAIARVKKSWKVMKRKKTDYYNCTWRLAKDLHPMKKYN